MKAKHIMQRRINRPIQKPYPGPMTPRAKRAYEAAEWQRVGKKEAEREARLKAFSEQLNREYAMRHADPQWVQDTQAALKAVGKAIADFAKALAANGSKFFRK